MERANKTLQDRLVKEFRLQGVRPIDWGRQRRPAPVFMAAYNACLVLASREAYTAVEKAHALPPNLVKRDA